MYRNTRIGLREILPQHNTSQHIHKSTSTRSQSEIRHVRRNDESGSGIGLGIRESSEEERGRERRSVLGTYGDTDIPNLIQTIRHSRSNKLGTPWRAHLLVIVVLVVSNSLS